MSDSPIASSSSMFYVREILPLISVEMDEEEESYREVGRTDALVVMGDGSGYLYRQIVRCVDESLNKEEQCGSTLILIPAHFAAEDETIMPERINTYLRRHADHYGENDFKMRLEELKNKRLSDDT